MKKKLISLLLVFSLLVSLVTVISFADNDGLKTQEVSIDGEIVMNDPNVIYYLTKDVHAYSEITIKDGVTVEGNGHTLDVASSDVHVDIENASINNLNLYIHDCGLEYEGVSVSIKNCDFNGGSITCKESCGITFEGNRCYGLNKNDYLVVCGGQFYRDGNEEDTISISENIFDSCGGLKLEDAGGYAANFININNNVFTNVITDYAINCVSEFTSVSVKDNSFLDATCKITCTDSAEAVVSSNYWNSLSSDGMIYGSATKTSDADLTSPASGTPSYSGDKDSLFQIERKHKYGDWTVTKDPTCTEEGSRTASCSACMGAYATKITETIEATGHDLNKTEAVEATCTDKGNIEYYICSTCGKYYSDNQGNTEIAEDSWIIDATGHSYGEWEITKEATCMEDGSKERTCSTCKEVEKETIAATGHSLTKTAAKAATCTEQGNSEYYTCSTCDKYFSDSEGTNEIKENSWITEATGHSYGDWKVTKEATCTEEGTKERTCSACKDVDTASIKATGHSLKKTAAVEPTCTEAGNSEYYTCSNCSKYFSDSKGTKEIEKDSWVIDATGHSYGDWEVTKKATCTEAGSQQKICSQCKDVVTEEIKATGHKLTKTDAVAATCTKDGNSEYYTCSTCGKYFSDAEGAKEIEKDSWIIKATGHSLTKTAAKAATCEEAGNSEYYTCSDCGKYFSDSKGTEEIEKNSWVTKATGHSLTKTAAKAATCDTAGNSEYYTCSE